MSLETIDRERLPNLDGLKILDLGCGEGRHSISTWIVSTAVVAGLDLSIADLKTARSRMSDFPVVPTGDQQLHFIQASGFQVPFDDHTFDVVICSEVLEHIEEYQDVLEEIDRVLRPGGTFAMSVPRFGPEWVCWKLSREYHEVPGGHVRIFNARELRQKIESLGMQHYGSHWAHALHSPYWWLKCLFWSTSENNPLVRAYHRMLVWDLMKQPWLTQTLETVFNPLFGKSIAMYFRKPKE